MSKMNWDRVRWEHRAVRQGSEWASSENVTPQPGLYVSAPIDSRSGDPAPPGSKKKKKRTKRKVAQWNVQTKEKATGNSKPNAIAGPIIKVPPKAAGSLKNPPGGVVSQVNREEKAPVFVQKVSSNGLRRARHAPDPLSLPEVQRLAIRLNKALSKNRLLEAASLAQEIRTESLRHIENATRKKIGN